jgi:hypothetical protein
MRWGTLKLSFWPSIATFRQDTGRRAANDTREGTPASSG